MSAAKIRQKACFIKYNNHSLCVPIVEFNARVINNDGSGEVDVIGTPIDIANTPPTLSGYGSILPDCISWRHNDMFDVYSNVRK